jgi:spore maturation protein A
MILIAIIFAIFSGNLSCITNAAIISSREAVSVCLTMLGILSMWTGIIKIAEKSGLIDSLTKKMLPLLKFLFPNLSQESKAIKYIATNIIANVFGLSWAATPAGLKAMEELQKINTNKNIASREMCMFMILNMSSLQLVSINIIAYRSQYKSANPSEIIGPGLFATFISTISAIIITKFFEKREDISLRNKTLKLQRQ